MRNVSGKRKGGKTPPRSASSGKGTTEKIPYPFPNGSGGSMYLVVGRMQESLLTGPAGMMKCPQISSGKSIVTS